MIEYIKEAKIKSSLKKYLIKKIYQKCMLKIYLKLQKN